jgi:AraC-like DNA-binding protein
MQNLSLNIFNILILIGCVQGLLLSTLLLRNNKFSRKSNFYLGIMILSFSLSNFRQFFLDVGLSKRYPIVWFMPLIFGFLIPVVYYFFIQYLMNPGYRTGRKLYWLLVPFFIHFVFQMTGLVFFLIGSPFLFAHQKAFRDISVGMEVASIIYCFVILIVTMADMVRYEKKLKENFSSVNDKTLSWLRNLIFALAGLWALWGIPYLYEVFTNHFLQWHHYPLWIGMSIVVYWIGYSAYGRAEVFEAPAFVPLEEKAQARLSGKTDEHHSRLIECMKIRKPYLNAELTLEGLAKEIDLSAGYLSQIINRREGISFYDFINKYRVTEAKRILSDPKFDHYSILAIGLESGFNSKSTFNTAFKKYSGTTPSAYKTQALSHS